MKVTLKEVGVDPEGRLYAEPDQAEFPFIYRAAKGIGWDPAKQRLLGGRPHELSYLAWFRLMIAAVSEEYGVTLSLTPDTRWSGVQTELKSQIEAEGAKVGR